MKDSYYERKKKRKRLMESKRNGRMRMDCMKLRGREKEGKESNPSGGPVLLVPGSFVERTDGDYFEAIAAVLRLCSRCFLSPSSLRHSVRSNQRLRKTKCTKIFIYGGKVLWLSAVSQTFPSIFSIFIYLWTYLTD